MSNLSNAKSLGVFNIREMGEGKKPFFDRIGVAFVNGDGSLNVLMNTLPLDGKIHISEAKERPAQLERQSRSY